jgi:hypothetical protein
LHFIPIAPKQIRWNFSSVGESREETSLAAVRACLQSVAADVRRRIGTMKKAETIRLVTSAATKARVMWPNSVAMPQA